MFVFNYIVVIVFLDIKLLIMLTIIFSEANPELGVDPTSPLGLFIIFIGLIFTVGLPLTLILKGKKD